MKVLIALASSSGQISGVQRHAISLAKCLLMRDEIHEVHLVAAPWQQGFVRDAAPMKDLRLHLHAASIGNNARSRNAWFYFELPRLAKQLDADVVHLAYPVPVARGRFRCPVVVTLHDLYPYDIPENFGFPKVIFNQAVLRQCLRSVDAVACVSQTTQMRLKILAPKIALQKSSVVYNVVDPPSTLIASVADTPIAADSPFLFCVAQHRRNKNILLALRVFEWLLRDGEPGSLRMLIVGIAGPETGAIEEFIAEHHLSDYVTMANGLSEAKLAWCYRNCALLFAPSRIEGFGLPIAEALLAGCRVVCSDIPAFREVGGDHCCYVPLVFEAEGAFVHEIRRMLEGDRSRPEPVELPQLSSTNIARQYLKLYRSLLPVSAADEDAHLLSLSTREER